MRRTDIVLIGCLLGSLGLASCAGSAPEPTGPTGPPPTREITMRDAALSTAVDPETKRPAAETATVFPEDTAQIFLVATLENLPPDAEIEVKWLQSGKGDPLYVSTSKASGDHQLVAKLLPPMGKFQIADYQVFVYVSGLRLGSVRFRVGAAETRWTGVRELNVSGAVEAYTNKALEPRTSFHQGISKIYVSFLVRTDDERPYVRVSWLLDDEVFLQNDLECGGDVRCVDVYEAKKPIVGGDYGVEVDVNGEVLSHKTFHVGDTPVAPVLDFAALGVAKGKKKMPRGSPKGPVAVKSGVKGLRVGFKLLALPDEATVRVKWVAVRDGGDELLDTTEVALTGGGAKTEVVDWEPETPLEPGRYKAMITLGERVLEELGFTIE